MDTSIGRYGTRHIEGLDDLRVRLNAMEKKVAVSTLRKAMRRASRPVFMAMKNDAPVGNEPHRSYRGRILAPGSLKRSIRLLTKVDKRRGTLSVLFGVRREMFYGINFLDLGPHQVRSRRGGRRLMGRHAIKPYTIRQRPWFLINFMSRRGDMEDAFRSELKMAIEEARRVKGRR